MNHPNDLWMNLPELVLTDIYKLLDLKDRLAASSTCKQWRSVLFQSCFWVAVKFDTARRNVNKNDFIIEKTAHLYNKIEVYLNSTYNVTQTRRLFKRLSHSKCLHSLVIRIFACDHRTYIPSSAQEQRIAELFVDPVIDIVQNAPIQVLDLGCYEQLALFSSKVLNNIKQLNLITKLGFATIKRNPSEYPVGELYQMNDFKALTNLQMISLDYDLLDESMLLNFNRLKRLIIHIHGVENNHKGLSEQSWKHFKIKNPNATVRITLIRALEAIDILHTEILRPSIPLTHLRVFFCKKLNRRSLDFISIHYKYTLINIVWVDDKTEAQEDMDRDVELDVELDPFVMMSWMCIKLQDVIILGHYIDIDSVIAIARLRGPNLRRLQVDPDCIYHISKNLRTEVIKQIESALERSWNYSSDPIYKAMCNTRNMIHKKFFRNKFIYNIIKNDITVAKRRSGKFWMI